MFKLERVLENPSLLTLKWDAVPDAHEYSVEGVTSIFGYVPITSTKETRITFTKKSDYIGYRIVANIVDDQNKKYILDKTEIVFSKTSFDKVEIFILDAPNNKKSYSFRSEYRYDLYRMYDKDKNFIADTEDFIYIDSDNKPIYSVEAYEKTDKGYVLKAISFEAPTKIDLSKDKTEKKINIIIPVYNSGDFIIRTLQCILSSTYTGFKIILVDDCSEEYTADICNQYKNMYGKHIVLLRHDHNKNICATRNTGLANVSLEYTAFCDHDDMVHPYMYEKLLKAIDNGKFDIAIAQCYMKSNFENGRNLLYGCKHDESIEYHSFEDMTNAKGGSKNIYFTAVWNKLIKSSIATRVQFVEEAPWYEDYTYSHSTYSYAKDYILIGDAYYVWDKRKQYTVGTASNTIYKGLPNEIIWRHHAFSIVGILLSGNQDPEIAKVYKKEVVKDLINTYHDKLRNSNSVARRVYAAIMLYYYDHYHLPFNELADGDDKQKEKYMTWQKILTSGIKSWDGFGDVPKELYDLS